LKKKIRSIILIYNCSISDDNNLSEKQIIKLGETKLEENNMVKLIRREKEKNKEILEEIRKIKNNINNLN
jgi:hypothetical protein